MRIAFVDMMFSWPPRGGAPVDLYHVAEGLQRHGHDVRLFYADNPDNLAQGSVDPSQLPFPAESIGLTGRAVPEQVAAAFGRAVDAWKPDAVFHGLAFFMRPILVDALSHYPSIGRYYAYEAGCPRDFRLFKDGGTCPDNYLRTPDLCRRCTLERLGPALKSGRPDFYTHEYWATGAYGPAFHRRYVESLRRLRTVIVSNELARGHFDGFHDDVRILPGGVDLADYPESEASSAGNPPVIFMPGRVDDPAKGLSSLLKAGEKLAESSRSDFEIHLTHGDYSLERDWVRCLGWQDGPAVRALYRRADVVVVPSLWDEPFGLVAVEAMAAGKPVCASRVGGLQAIVVDGETGFLHERGDDSELATQLGRLLEDGQLRRRMGEAGRRRAETEYDWPRVIERYYVPLFEGLRP